MRRPIRVTILVAMFITCGSSRNVDVGEFELAAALDVDLLRPVDHDVGDGLVGDQRLERAEPQHVGEQRLDEFALLGEVELDFGLGQQLLDPAGQLRLERRARHLGRRGDVHVFEDERLDLRLGRLDRRACAGCADCLRVGIAAAGGQQRLQDVGDEVAPRQRVGVDRMADEIGLHRGVDDLGEIAAAQQAARSRAGFRR